MVSMTDALAATKVFEGIAPAGLAKIATIVTETRFAKGQHVFKQEDPGEEFYLVLEGKVRISRTVPGVGEEAFAVLGPGEAFGEMSIVDDSPRSADAIAHEEARLMVIRKSDLHELLFLDKALAYEVLWNFVTQLTGRLRQANDKVTFLSVTGRF